MEVNHCHARQDYRYYYCDYHYHYYYYYHYYYSTAKYMITPYTPKSLLKKITFFFKSNEKEKNAEQINKRKKSN